MPEQSQTGSILGISDFGPVGGTPLIPPSYLTLYFAVLLLLLGGLYIYFYRKKKPLLWRRRLKLLFFLAIAINVVGIIGTGILAAYWLIPTPGIRRTTPVNDEQKFTTVGKIEIVFDRPVDRNELKRAIYPETPGQWVFENSIYTTHLYRKLVFYPLYSLRPDTVYSIKLSGIRNFVKVSQPYDFEFSFKTQNSPVVPVVAPFNREEGVDVKTDINVVLDKRNENMSEFAFGFEPEVKFVQSLDENKRVYNLKPYEPLKQGTKYNLRIKKSDIIINLQDGSVVERGSETQVYEKSFTTKEAPGINSFEPANNNTEVDANVSIEFSKEMKKKSVESSFSIEPATGGSFVWDTDSKLKFDPRSLAYDTEYKVTLKKGAEAKDLSFLQEDVAKTFKTIGPVRISNVTPESGWTGVNIKSKVKVVFDQEVDHDSAQSKFSISPETAGNFNWEGNSLAFTPVNDLVQTTKYKISIKSGIKSINGQDSNEDFNFEFTTQYGTVKLNVPAYYQKYSLSCEFASLRMALAFKGVSVSEDELISKVGFDPTSYHGNVWGDPYIAFVGNIAGKQMVDGYGVYWGPIAKAAKNYKEAQEFEGWSIGMLTTEILSGNPVVIWVYAGSGVKTSWNTPNGKNIYAVRDEHAVTAVGFVGDPQNPSQVIVNDPLKGQVYMSRTTFDRKWNIFNRSGVVVR